MEIILNKKPKSPIFIEGFPGFGLIGTIVTEYLIDHLDVESIGTVISDEIPPMIAIHGGKIVQPIEIFYSRKYNIMFLHVVTNPFGLEWQFSEIVMKLAKMVQASEIISIEGVGASNEEEELVSPKTFYYTNDEQRKKLFQKIGVDEMKEGVVMGVTGTILLKAKNMKQKLSCIFVQTMSNLPDSKAAAAVIRILDKYLNLKVDPKPLEQEAEKFEHKLRTIMDKSKEASELQQRKTLSYVG